jgi:MFS family permease
MTGAFSLFMVVSGMMAYPVGSWIDRHGGRWLMTGGSILSTLLIIAWSQVTDLGMFYLIWAGLGVAAAATLYEPAFAVVTTWFVRRRSAALTLITFAAGLASTIFVPLSDALLQAHGWRNAIFILGIVLAVTTILPHALILRRRPSDMGLLPDGEAFQADAPPPAITGTTVGEALHSRVFWVLTLAFGLSALSAQAIRIHIIPYLMENGIDSSTAALASGAIGLMQVAGRAVFAPLDSHYSGRVMVTWVLGLQAVSMLILLLSGSPLTVLLFIMIFGTSYGAKTLARASVVGKEFGSSHYGRISSVMSAFLTFGWTIGPVGAGYLYDLRGNYDLMVWVIIGLSLTSVGVMALIRTPTTHRVPIQSPVA